MAVGAVASHERLCSKTRSLRGAAKQASARSRDLELRIWTLLSEGKTPSAIACDVGIARQSVHRIIRRVEAKYNQQIAASVGALKARQARALEAVLDEALDAGSAASSLRGASIRRPVVQVLEIRVAIRVTGRPRTSLARWSNRESVTLVS